jgi:hypothetical protein
MSKFLTKIPVGVAEVEAMFPKRAIVESRELVQNEDGSFTIDVQWENDHRLSKFTVPVEWTVDELADGKLPVGVLTKEQFEASVKVRAAEPETVTVKKCLKLYGSYRCMKDAGHKGDCVPKTVKPGKKTVDKEPNQEDKEKE